jgi:hypothetical protein
VDFHEAHREKRFRGNNQGASGRGDRAHGKAAGDSGGNTGRIGTGRVGSDGIQA